jgi:uncharacterized protein (DUF362 family)
MVESGKSVVLAAKTDNRRGFVSAAMERFAEAVNGGPVLVKPNLVSHEPYPTTTHPDVLDEVLALLKGREVIVADGPGADLMRPGKVIREHELTAVCERHGIKFTNVYRESMSKFTAPGVKITMSGLPKKAAAMISLPVLKSHKICMMTGALKNHFGFLAKRSRGKLHFGAADIHKGIAALNRAAPGSLFIVDAVVTEVGANEMRHGGRPTELWHMLAGTDPVGLDAFGLTLLQKVEPALRGKGPMDVPYLKYCADWGLGSVEYDLEWTEQL